MVPVDYVSRAIIELSRGPRNLGSTFHLSNPRPLPYQELVQTIQSLGIPLTVVSFDQWRNELANRVASAENSDWLSFLPLIEEVDESQVFMPPFDCRNTLDGLANSDVYCPPVGFELFSTYLKYFDQLG